MGLAASIWLVSLSLCSSVYFLVFLCSPSLAPFMSLTPSISPFRLGSFPYRAVLPRPCPSPSVRGPAFAFLAATVFRLQWHCLLRLANPCACQDSVLFFPQNFPSFCRRRLPIVKTCRCIYLCILFLGRTCFDQF